MSFVQSVTKHLPSQQLNDILTFITNLIPLLYKMPEYVMSYFDALRKWNLGGSAWCIPRKDTILQKQLNKIRTGEIESKQDIVKQIVEETKKKRAPKKEKTSMNIKI